MVTKPVFAAQNSVNPYGIYIFLAKDLHISKKSTNFAAELEKGGLYVYYYITVRPA